MKIVAIADLHVGGRVALADPEVSGRSDAGYPVRAALYERWQEAASGPWAKPDALIIDGDIVEGKNRRKGGAGCWTTEPLDQVNHAAKLIKMWDANRTYVLRGSDYHVDSEGLPIEEVLARKIGAEEYPNQEHIDEDDREHSGWHWFLHFDGVTIHVSHHISVSKVFHYQSTPTARQMLQAKLNDPLVNWPDFLPNLVDWDADLNGEKLAHQFMEEIRTFKTQVVLRAHAHYYNTVGYSGTDGFVLPCWKGLDEYMLKKGPLDIKPDLGFLGFTIEDGDWKYEKNLFKLTDVQKPPLTVVRRRRSVRDRRGAGAGRDRPKARGAKRPRAGARGRAGA